MNAGPIFITGLDHSGKTRLRLLLGASSRLSLTRRTELWTAPHGAHGHLREDTGLDACLSSLMERRAVAEMVADPAELRTAFRAGLPTHARLFVLIHAQHAARLGADRWGDQDSQVERAADAILAGLPDALIVHLVVDPRRRYAALTRAGIARPGMVGAATAAWVASVRRGIAGMARHPHRYRLVMSEAIEDGTGLDGLRRFLQVTDVAADPVHRVSPPQYLRVHDRDAAFIETMAREEMTSLGYPIVGRALTGVERARAVALHGPVGRARYWVRMMRERALEAQSRSGGEGS